MNKDELVNGFGYFLCGSDEVPGFAPCPSCGEEDWELYEAGADWRGVAALYYWIAKCASCGSQVPGKALVFPGEDKFVEIVEAAILNLNLRVACADGGHVHPVSRQSRG